MFNSAPKTRSSREKKLPDAGTTDERKHGNNNYQTIACNDSKWSETISNSSSSLIEADDSIKSPELLKSNNFKSQYKEGHSMQQKM